MIVISLDFSKHFGTVSHSILPEKLQLMAWTVHYLLGKELDGGPGPESSGEWS